MNRKSLFTALFIISLLILPLAGSAKMNSLTDDQLGAVVGQAGIALSVDNLKLDMTMDTLHWGDTDGLGGLSRGGYLSLCDVALAGNIDFKNPMTVNIVTQQNKFGTEVQGIDMHLSDMTVDIDRFTVDAIRLGPNPGEGPSLGSFGIYNMHVDIKGDVKISVN